MNIQLREGKWVFYYFLERVREAILCLRWIEVGIKMKTKGQLLWGLYTRNDQIRSKNFSEEGGELLVLARVDIRMNSHQ